MIDKLGQIVTMSAFRGEADILRSDQDRLFVTRLGLYRGLNICCLLTNLSFDPKLEASTVDIYRAGVLREQACEHAGHCGVGFCPDADGCQQRHTHSVECRVNEPRGSLRDDRPLHAR